MRVLFTTTGGSGHFHPLVPLAQATRAAGHAVAFACPRSLCPQVEALGFPAMAAGRDGEEDPKLRRALAHLPRLQGPHEANAYFLAVIFGRIGGRVMMQDLLEICRHWEPDLLVREAYEFGAALAGEHLAVPHATVLIDSYATWPAPWQTALAAQLDALRQVYGLPPDPALAGLHRHLSLSFEPPSYRDPATPVPPALHHLRATSFDRTGDEGAPGWLDDLAAQADRPLVYVTLGTAFNKAPGVLEAVVGALRDEPLSLVVTVGRDRDPAELGPQPPHIRVARYIPQSLVLPHCRLVICHGGHGTVMGALAAGVPVVTIPFAADQPENAARCTALGIGRRLAPDALAPERVREVVGEVLRDPRYRANAERLCGELEALPGLDHGVRLLETLVAETVMQPP